VRRGRGSCCSRRRPLPPRANDMQTAVFEDCVARIEIDAPPPLSRLFWDETVPCLCFLHRQPPKLHESYTLNKIFTRVKKTALRSLFGYFRGASGLLESARRKILHNAARTRAKMCPRLDQDKISICRTYFVSLSFSCFLQIQTVPCTWPWSLSRGLPSLSF